MNWDAVGALAELVGAVGVIVTLIYLSRQVRDNTDSIRRSTAHEALQSIAGFNEFVAGDPELVELFWRGTADPDGLSKGEWQRFVSLASTLVRRFELLYLDHLGGALPDELWAAQLQNISTWMSSAGAKRWFESFGSHVHGGFRDLVTNLPGKAE